MPFSKKQLRWAHTPTGEAKLGRKKVSEWDAEAKGMDLPEASRGASELDLPKKTRNDKGPGNHFRTAGGNRGLVK